MTDDEHPAGTSRVVIGTIIGIVVAAVFCWLFAALAGVSVTSGAVVTAFVLLGAWTVLGGLMYGAADESDGATAH